MTKAKTGWLLLGVLCLASFAVAQDTALEKYTDAGIKAYRQGQGAYLAGAERLRKLTASSDSLPLHPSFPSSQKCASVSGKGVIRQLGETIDTRA